MFAIKRTDTLYSEKVAAISRIGAVCSIYYDKNHMFISNCHSSWFVFVDGGLCRFIPQRLSVDEEKTFGWQRHFW